MVGVVYRLAKKEDKEPINNLFIEMIKTISENANKEDLKLYEFLLNGYEEGYLDTFFENEERKIFVAEFNGEVVGFLSICLHKDLDYIYLDDYCVKSQYRGFGVGSRLIEMAFEDADKFEINNIRAHVDCSNYKSIKFYKNKGFDIIDKEKNRFLINKKMVKLYDRSR